MNALFDDRFINSPKPMNKIINWEHSDLFKRKINKLSRVIKKTYIIFSETNQTNRLRADSRKRCE